jgi:hypothetical protein
MMSWVRMSGELLDVLLEVEVLAVVVVAVSVVALLALVCLVLVVSPVLSESSKSEAEVRVDMATLASFREQAYLWTDQDKTTIGTARKTVQGTFDISCATFY